MARWGQARMEVLALHPEIKAEMARGVPIKQVYEALLKLGQVTVTYNGFRRQVLPIRDELLNDPVRPLESPSIITKPQVKLPTETSSQPSHEVKPKSAFKFNPVSNAEDFF